MEGRLFVTWHDSRRSASLAQRLGLQRRIFVANRSGALRHVIGVLRTIGLLVTEHPHKVWYQYSFMLGLVLSVYARCFPHVCPVLVADVHSKALRRDGGRLARPLVLALKRWSMRACSAVLVTNPENRQFAEHRLGVGAFVLPDPLPSSPKPARSAGPATFHSSTHTAPVVFVCSFARDEPIDLMVATGELLRGDATIAFTGDSRTVPRKTRDQLSSIGHLTGFLPDSDYWELLRNAGTIVVPTTEPACLPCGAYEAIAVGRRPVLLTDERARSVFGELAIFAVPDSTSLAAAITTGRGPAGRLRTHEIVEYEQRWQAWWNALPTHVRSPGDFYPSNP